MTSAFTPRPEMLRIQDLHAYYGESHILHGINLKVARGECVTLLGRNGAGRSTTLKSVLGLVSRRTGSIMVNGREVIAEPTHRMARYGIGYVPEERAIFASLSSGSFSTFSSGSFSRIGACATGSAATGASGLPPQEASRRGRASRTRRGFTGFPMTCRRQQTAMFYAGVMTFSCQRTARNYLSSGGNLPVIWPPCDVLTKCRLLSSRGRHT